MLSIINFIDILIIVRSMGIIFCLLLIIISIIIIIIIRFIKIIKKNLFLFGLIILFECYNLSRLLYCGKNYEFGTWSSQGFNEFIGRLISGDHLFSKLGGHGIFNFDNLPVSWLTSEGGLLVCPNY